MLGIRMLKWSFTSSRTRRSSKKQKQKGWTGWTGHPHAESGNEQERIRKGERRHADVPIKKQWRFFRTGAGFPRTLPLFPKVWTCKERKHWWHQPRHLSRNLKALWLLDSGQQWPHLRPAAVFPQVSPPLTSLEKVISENEHSGQIQAFSLGTTWHGKRQPFYIKVIRSSASNIHASCKVVKPVWHCICYPICKNWPRAEVHSGPKTASSPRRKSEQCTGHNRMQNFDIWNRSQTIWIETTCKSTTYQINPLLLGLHGMTQEIEAKYRTRNLHAARCYDVVPILGDAFILR